MDGQAEMNWEKMAVYHAVFLLLTLWPAYRICRRAGINPVWVIALCVPVFGMVIFSCALAFQRWPQPGTEANDAA